MSFLTKPVTVSLWVLLLLIMVAVVAIVSHLLPFVRAAVKGAGEKKDEAPEKTEEEEDPLQGSVEESSKQAPATEEDPYWDLYRADAFHSLRWRWTYTDKLEPREIGVFCPRCDTPLTAKSAQYWVDFGCEQCGNDLKRIRGSWKSILAGVRKDIERKIETGEWKKVKPLNPHIA